MRSLEWLLALAGTQMSAAIRSMHDDPAHRWTLQKLAKRAGMPRSVFALKFKQTLGTLLCPVGQRIHMSVLCIAIGSPGSLAS